MTATVILPILTANILLRLTAAALVLRLARLGGRSQTWWLLAAAVLVLTLRPFYTLCHALLIPQAFAPRLETELFGLAVSVLLLVGIGGLRPLLLEVRNQGERYRRIVEATKEGILIVNNDGVVVFVNRQLEQMLGYQKSALRQCRFLDLVTLASRIRATALLNPQAGGPGPIAEICLHTADGGELCTLLSCSPIGSGREGTGDTLLMAMDISDRRRIEEVLQDAESFARATVDALAQRVAILDGGGRVLATNRCWQEHAHCPFPAQPEVGDNYLELLDRAAGETNLHAEAFAGGIRGVLAGQLSEFTLEFPRAGEEGSRWYLGRITPFSNSSGTYAVVTHDDITPLKTAEDAVKQLAYQDALTGLPNRLLLQDRLDQQLIQAGREKEQVAVLFLDLDHLKVINDTLGHSAGDELLQTVAQRLLGCVRKSDTVARIGGDEFVIILNRLENSGDATVTARKILHAMTLPIRLKGQEIFTSTSIGIALYPDDADQAEILIGHADMAMYLAKEQGRNTYRYFSSNLNERAQQRLRLETHLRRALQRGEILLHFQDQVEIAGGRLCGVEALLRWQHPERGLLLPGEFLALAEETGLIIPIGAWVLRRACERARAWETLGLPTRVRIAVNLSRRQLLDSELLPTLRDILADTGLPPERLELEITENILQQDPAHVTTVLNRLQKLGVTIAVDNFGTGFTSLNLLRRLPVQRLKIDHTFIANLFTDDTAAAIARTTISIAHNLGLRVIAEGVESDQQLEFLRSHGCDEIQGYYLDRPAPEADLLRAAGKPPAAPLN
jgi:diguanylate cyclase (GGDEF)-like protein/PAS domain S-box-containing protein